MTNKSYRLSRFCLDINIFQGWCIIIGEGHMIKNKMSFRRINFDCLSFIGFFFHLINYVKYSFCPGNSGQENVKLVGQFIQWSRKLPGILCENNNHSNRDMTFNDENSTE